MSRAGAGGEQSVLCTGMAMIKGNIKGERGGQTFRKPVFSCNVFLQGRHTRFPFGSRIQGYREQGMVDEWIAESVRDSGGKCQKIIFWKIQGRNDFVINGSMEKSADHRIVHAVSYDILAGQISAEYEGGMRTIQNANLSLLKVCGCL